ncbi:MAG TPA: pseudouridine synthase [Bdellovibrionota bacterium]|jgi:tRNA pseudouridine65 synthase|nr:pseudouridine synthase [Bdellovibrionota bacterium]
MSGPFDILHIDDHLVVIDKPEGFHVHRPELKGVKVDDDVVVLQRLRDQLGRWVYPVHRLDAPTSGCLVLAFSGEVASQLSKGFGSEDFQKTYTGVVRGWTAEQLEIELPLESPEDKAKLLPSLSRLRRLATTEFEESVGKRHATARFSLVELEPVTGRFHQLRRHLNRVAHPLVGDVMHGDRYQNHFFAQRLGIEGLCLRASALSFLHPESGQRIEIKAPITDKWRRIRNVFDSPSHAR